MSTSLKRICDMWMEQSEKWAIICAMIGHTKEENEAFLKLLEKENLLDFPEKSCRI